MFKKNTKSPEQIASDMRRFKLGGFGVLISVAAIAIVVVVYLIIGSLPSNVTKRDLSANKVYEVSDDSVKFLQGLNEDVTIYLSARSSKRDDALDLFLRKYAKESKHLKINYVDPEINPALINKYAEDELSENSLIIVSDMRGTTLDYYSLYEYDIYYQDSLYTSLSSEDFSQFYSYYGSYFENGTLTYSFNFNGEALLATAIDYVSVDHLPTIYSLEGHGETKFSDLQYIPAYLTQDNITTKSFNINSTGAVPSDCDCLVIIAPGSDITENEYTIINTYLENGGKLMVFAGSGASEYTKIMKLCENYGLGLLDSKISDKETGYYYYDDETILMPSFGSHSIMSNVEGYTVNTKSPVAVTVTDVDNITHSTLLKSSSKATLIDGEEEKTGPFDIGVIAEKSQDGVKSSVILVSCNDFMSDNYIHYGNIFFMLSASEYMTAKETSITIGAKELASETISVDSTVIIVFAAIACFVIPVATVVIGIVIHALRRKH